MRHMRPGHIARAFLLVVFQRQEYLAFNENPNK